MVLLSTLKHQTIQPQNIKELIMLQRAVGLFFTLLVVFGLSLLLIPGIGMLIGVLNEFIKNV